MNLNQLYDIANTYSKYNYIDSDFSKYHIKTQKEFESCRGGVCWDFMLPMSQAINDARYIHHCYFTSIMKDGKMIGSHTYIIVRDGPFHYWVEAAWQKHKGIHLVFSYKDVERLLKESYNADELHTVVYDPTAVEGNTANEFFEYLNKEGVELS